MRSDLSLSLFLSLRRGQGQGPRAKGRATKKRKCKEAPFGSHEILRLAVEPGEDDGNGINFTDGRPSVPMWRSASAEGGRR